MDELDPPLAGMPRPRENPALVGHARPREAIEAMWRAGRLHHAHMFSGIKGIGKATFAYRLAKMVLSRSDSFEASVGTDVDRQIAGGASNGFRCLSRTLTKEGRPKREIGVDEVRALEPFLRQRVGGDEWRVVLIDSVNDLNASSSNALLKILEEPGERTLFLMIAHGSGQILATIRSRCTAHRFDALSPDEVAQVLASSDLSENSVRLAAEMARGSVRRAITLGEGDGARALAILPDLMRRNRWSAGEAQTLVDAAAGRGKDAMFAIARDELNRVIAEAATATGDPTRAARIADRATGILEGLDEREKYGVDRAVSFKAALMEAHGVVTDS